MKIKSAEFVQSAPDLKLCPAWARPEFAFIGRSNVGKSSLINLLTERRDLARVSDTPGKTQLINFYLVNTTWSLVDLPGYGYAKVAREQRFGFNQAVADFLFDWMVHRPGNTEKSGGCVYFMEAKIFGMAKGTALQSGGVYSDALVQLINSTDPAGFYNALKFWRLWHLTNTNTYKSFLKGIYNRITKFNDFPPTENVVEMMKAAKNRAFGY